MSPLRRLLVKGARTVHLYLTLFGLTLLLLFAVTGFMLNHESWFTSGEPQTRTAAGTIPTAMLVDPDKLAVVELLRKDFASTGALDSFEVEDESLRVVFKQPGRQVEAVIQREDGKLELTYESRGWYGLFTDLHRGKATGSVWSLVIDGVCVMILLVAATGLFLWSSLRGRGRFGLAAIGLGLGVGLFLYFAFVP